MSPTNERYDAIVIGSGFGGAFAASVLVDRGLRVLMLERGDWVERGPHNWEPTGAIDLTPQYSKEAPYVVRGEKRGEIASVYCVGGPSLFYGAVSLRLRESDFQARPDAATRWPFDYPVLEPYYARAERMLGVAGDDGAGREDVISLDPTAPPRSGPYPERPAPLSRTSRMIAEAAASLGLSPFRLPLAINYQPQDGRNACVACVTCDAFICAIGAKNDLASALLPKLVARGLDLVSNQVAVRLNAVKGVIRSVDSVDRRSGEGRRDEADLVVLAAGALGTPHLLLGSGLAALNPAGDVVGRYLMRHCNGMVYSLFREPVNPDGEFHKQVGLHDFYNGGVGEGAPEGKLGTIQQIHSPPLGLAQDYVPRLLHRPLPWLIARTTGLLAVAEDEPVAHNRVELMGGATDRFGMPRLRLTHRYTKRDRAARRALLAQAKRVMRAAGGRVHYRHNIPTFSHAVGTVRMGEDAQRSPLDSACRFRGVENLLVVDGSVFPASGGVNPSLTIAANALRAAELACGGPAPAHADDRAAPLAGRACP